jgi:hypothetical protein
LYLNTVTFTFSLQLTKSQREEKLSNLIVTRNFMEMSQEFLLNLVLSEDLYWPEHILYLACYFWSKYQVCQQLENTLKEMSKALSNMVMTIPAKEGSIKNSDTDDSDDVQVITEDDIATLKTYMEPLLPHIRLLTIDASILKTILMEYSCFTAVEKGCVNSCFLGINTFACLPENFCNLKKSRGGIIQSAYVFGFVEGETANLSSGELFYQSSTMEFNVDIQRNYYLSRMIVRFPSQIKPPGVESKSYEDSFTVILVNNGNEHKTGPLTKWANYNSYIVVDICTPPKFCDNICSTVSVTILQHKSGVYPTYLSKNMTLSAMVTSYSV